MLACAGQAAAEGWWGAAPAGCAKCKTLAAARRCDVRRCAAPMSATISKRSATSSCAAASPPPAGGRVLVSVRSSCAGWRARDQRPLIADASVHGILQRASVHARRAHLDRRRC